MLRDLRVESNWNALMKEKGYDIQIPVKPLHVRLRGVLAGIIVRRREWLALRIAPWLEQEDDF